MVNSNIIYNMLYKKKKLNNQNNLKKCLKYFENIGFDFDLLTI